MKTPSASNNQFGIDCSFPGLCSYCHSEVAIFQGSREVTPGVFRPIIVGFKPNIRHSTFRLNDGTQMTVVLCEQCDDDIEPEHMAHLMESEINGWQKEIEDLCKGWPEDKKLDYMDEHAEKAIVDRTSKRWTDTQLSRLSSPRKNNLKVKVRKK